MAKIRIPVYGMDYSIKKLARQEEEEERIRLQYVAATRAAHSLIIMPEIASDVWFSAPEYEYEKLDDINQWLKGHTEAKVSGCTDSGGLDTGSEMINLKDLKGNIEKSDFAILSECQSVSINPSGLEKGGVTGLKKKEEGYSKESRPGGNVLGTVMHRVYELIFMRWNSIKDMADPTPAIERAVNQAIMENRDDLRRDKDDPVEFKNYLFDKMKVYFDLVIKDIMDNAAEVYPEYSFSFFVKGVERDEFRKWLGAFLDDKKIELKETDDQTIWVNGQADLVIVQNDGRVKVYDYKSDAMNGKPEADFKDSMEKKYEGQLALYRYAIGKAFGVDPQSVNTELISLYRK